MALPWASASASDNALTLVDTLADTSDTHVIDIRNLQDCEGSSLPRGRCLPVDNFVDPTGKIIGFHALRWLLGTVGLNGTEKVLVIGDTPSSVRTVGALLYLAGQKDVAVLEVPFAPRINAAGGTGRSLSREAIFTAAMRDTYVLTLHQDNASSEIDLAHFALVIGRGEHGARIKLALDQ